MDMRRVYQADGNPDVFVLTDGQEKLRRGSRVSYRIIGIPFYEETKHYNLYARYRDDGVNLNPQMNEVGPNATFIGFARHMAQFASEPMLEEVNLF